jgi:curved DNA-binding protein CbpA
VATPNRELYEKLGVSGDATVEAIKQAFRGKAKQLHPDAGGDAAAFAELKRAYDTLADPVRRLTYDRTGRVDGGPADSIDAAARGLIASLLEQFITSADDVFSQDLVAVMEALIEAKRQEVETKRAEFRALAKRTERLIKRFKKKARKNKQAIAGDPVGLILEGRRRQFEDNAAQGARVLEQIARAAEIVRGYTFTADMAQPTRATATGFAFMEFSVMRPR